MRRLIIRPGAIGDCLCFLPVLHALRADYTEVWVPGAVAPLVGCADAVRNLAGTGFSLLGVPGVSPPAGLVERLRDFDEILSWSGWNQPELQAAVRALGLPVRFFPALPSPDAGVAVTDWFFQQTAEWHGMTAEPVEWREPGGRRFLLVPVAAPLVAEDKGAVVLHPYSGSAAKNWPLACFRRLAAELEGVARVRWCASPEDPLPADLLVDAMVEESLAAVAARVGQAALFVGNDSGITHLAAMLGVPVGVLFGPMDPVVWAPRGTDVRVFRPATVGEPASAIPYGAVGPEMVRWAEMLRLARS